MAAWVITLIAGLLGGLVIATNLQGLFAAWRQVRTGEPRSFSPTPLIGGILNAIAVWNCPLEAVRDWFALPLLLDPGPFRMCCS